MKTKSAIPMPKGKFCERTAKRGQFSRCDVPPLRTHHVFGPVPSRRLGRSLGVDLVPFKTCSYNCIYCQLGRTTCKTIERKEWVPMEAVLDELKRKLVCRPDYITLTGSGEPTLHSRLGEIIKHIRALCEVPVAVLTNGSLLWQRQVREELAQADVVLPSLDAGDASKFRFLNRPHPSLTFDRMLEGLVAFRNEFAGQYWLEVFLLGGYTAMEADVMKIAALAKHIRPDRIQLNTVTRPPTEDFALGVPAETLAGFVRHFIPRAEVVAKRSWRLSHKSGKANCDDVLNLLRRRPCRIDEVARGLGLNRLEVFSCLEAISGRGLVAGTRHNGGIYYRVKLSVSNPSPAVSTCSSKKQTIH